MYHFFTSSVDGHLGCNVLAVVNGASVNVKACVLFEIWFSQKCIHGLSFHSLDLMPISHAVSLGNDFFKALLDILNPFGFYETFSFIIGTVVVQS